MSAAYGEQLLSRIIDDNDPKALQRHNIDSDLFATNAERQVARFIQDYADQNGGDAPSYATVTGEVPEFFYIPDVSDSYDYLADKIRSAYAVNEYKRRLESDEFRQVFAENDAEKISDYLKNVDEDIKMRTSVRVTPGKSFDAIKNDFISEYEDRKEGRTFKAYNTPFKTLTEEIGGLYTSDIYGVFAESGRGKTYLTIAFVDALLRQGATVLVKSFEVGEYRWMARLISYMTAVEQVRSDSKGRKVGVKNRELLTGKLSDNEADVLEMTREIDRYYSGKLILQSKGEQGAGKLTRTIKELDDELTAAPYIDAVVVDPIYGFNDVYGRNSNNTSGGAAEQAARRFEVLVGEHNCVGIYTVQANTDKKQREEDGHRELKLPSRDQVKTTKALLDIATVLFSFDSNREGMALVGIEKGRDGGEDFELELLSLLDAGVLREIDAEEEARKFTEVF